jgi:acyl-lipid omega-6 desaturase (Delta-12 desaturase)
MEDEMPLNPMLAGAPTAAEDLPKIVSPYALPNRRKAILQLINTLVPFLALWAIMVWMLQNEYSYWLILALAVPTAGFQVRIFILFHDCCHGSLFESRKANTVVGYFAGILTFTPFAQWRRAHATHHESVGDLDRRGVGDIWIMTVDEYRAAPRWERIEYRLVRNAPAMLLVGPLIIFLIVHRFYRAGDRRQERISVVVTDVAIALIILTAWLTVGLRTYFLIQLPVISLAGAAGLWLFYVQHQFEGVYWSRHDVWDRLRAALEGSSYYRLPTLFRWFTANIGLHHVHHVQQRIPNYNLQQCFDHVSVLQSVQPLTMRRSLRCVKLNLWDEKQEKMVSFRSLRSYRM